MTIASALISAPETPIARIVSLWLTAFNDAPVKPREILDRAIDEDPAFLDALNLVVPGIAEHPHPPTLVRWLSFVENLPITTEDGDRYRIVRVGHRWSVVGS
jgi:hypothetical protein